LFALDEEISLREILEIIIKGWKVIGGIFLFAVVLAGILSYLALPVKYQADATIIFDKNFLDQQGLSINAYNQLINNYSRMEAVRKQLKLDKEGYTASSLLGSVKTKVDEKNNLIDIAFTGSDPQKTQEIVNALGEQSVVDFKKRLIDDKDRQIGQLEMQLKEIESQINNNPKLLGTNEINSSGGQVIQVPQVNPMYEKLAGRWDEINNALNQLKAEKDYLNKGIETGGKGLYVIFEKASLPGGPVSPRKMLNMALAGVLGLMAGVFVVFFREFWRKSSPGVNKQPNM
jgi:capsular polysaccharide biosynthesis protein